MPASHKNKPSSGSHKSKKENNNISVNVSAVKAKSEKKKIKAKPEWNDSSTDLSVHRLPPQKMLERHLRAMSKPMLFKLAGIDAPNDVSTSPNNNPRRISLSRKMNNDNNNTAGPSNEDSAKAHSPQTNTNGNNSKKKHISHKLPVADNKIDLNTSENSLDSVDNTSVDGSSQPQNNIFIPTRRRSFTAAPIHTPTVHNLQNNKQINNQNNISLHSNNSSTHTSYYDVDSDSFVSDNSFTYTVTPAETTYNNNNNSTSTVNTNTVNMNISSPPSHLTVAAPAQIHFSPWLKPNKMLSPVPEAPSPAEKDMDDTSYRVQQQQRAQMRSNELTSINNLPSSLALKELQQYHDVQRDLYSAEENTNSNHKTTATQSSELMPSHTQNQIQRGTNVLSQVRSSIENLRIEENNNNSAGIDMSGNSTKHFFTLMKQVADYLDEIVKTSKAEEQFRLSVVSSLSQCSQQIKSMAGTIQNLETENKKLKLQSLKLMDAVDDINEKKHKELSERIDKLDIALLTRTDDTRSKYDSIPHSTHTGTLSREKSVRGGRTFHPMPRYNPTDYSSLNNNDLNVSYQNSTGNAPNTSSDTIPVTHTPITSSASTTTPVPVSSNVHGNVIADFANKYSIDVHVPTHTTRQAPTTTHSHSPSEQQHTMPTVVTAAPVDLAQARALAQQRSHEREQQDDMYILDDSESDPQPRAPITHPVSTQRTLNNNLRQHTVPSVARQMPPVGLVQNRPHEWDKENVSLNINNSLQQAHISMNMQKMPTMRPGTAGSNPSAPGHTHMNNWTHTSNPTAVQMQQNMAPAVVQNPLGVQRPKTSHGRFPQ